eukprot:Amastigsp_a192632_17.p3 type:complete len:121 gc:universal Amastigsp_a192632_17:387-25(-)
MRKDGGHCCQENGSRDRRHARIEQRHQLVQRADLKRDRREAVPRVVRIRAPTQIVNNRANARNEHEGRPEQRGKHCADCNRWKDRRKHARDHNQSCLGMRRVAVVQRNNVREVKKRKPKR